MQLTLIYIGGENRLTKHPDKVTVLDDSFYKEDCEEYNDLSYIPEEEREIFIEKVQLSVFELHRRFKRNDIVLKPFYQRRGDVWNSAKKSKLIESILRNIPIPSIYFTETNNGKWEVIDGQQRLNAIFGYLELKFPLANLPVLSGLNKKYFDDLNSTAKINYQRKIEDYQLHIFIIKKESHPDIRFDIFERINEGATQLNAQEIRNSIYRGERVNFLSRLAKDINFKNVTKGKLQVNRMKDQEAVLRFLSFYLKGYPTYNGNLHAYLNDTLEHFQAYVQNTDNVQKVFSSTMLTVYSVFGEQSFMKKDARKKKMNMSLFDIISYSFAISDTAKLLRNKANIVRLLYQLIENDAEFNNSITANTLTIKNVCYRFETWLSALNNLINGEEKNDSTI